MNDAKYIGLDVHQATISATVLDSTGKLVMECSILETESGKRFCSFFVGCAAVCIADLRGRHLCRLVARLAQTPMSHMSVGL